MKSAKAFGLMLLVIGAFAAFAGSGTATATVFCEATESPCSESNRIGLEREIHATLMPETTARFETTWGYPLSQCSESTLTSFVVKAGGATSGVVSSENFSLGGCSSAVSQSQPGEFEATFAPGTDDGALTARNTFPFKILGFTIPAAGCTYKLRAGDPAGYLTGGGIYPQIGIYMVLFAGSAGGGCFEDIFFKATYIIDKPSSLYVGSS